MFGEQSVLSDDQIERIAARCDFVGIEKQHGIKDCGAAEVGAAKDARRLKKANPNMTVLFYWNSSIAYTFTSYARQFDKKDPVVFKSHPEWVARDAKGRPAYAHGRNSFLLYNVLDEGFRAWWASVPGEVVREHGFEGFFMDASCGPPVLRELDAKGTRAAILDMMSKARRAIGEEKLIIHNGFSELDMDKLEITDGFMLEHYNEALRSKEAIVRDWEGMKRAAEKKKICIFRLSPDLKNDSNRQSETGLNDDSAGKAKDAITYPLACYLMGAQEHSYFCYNWGWGLYTGPLVDYPEYHKPLGKPWREYARLSPDRWEFKREFEHCSVWVDLENRQARIDWAR